MPIVTHSAPSRSERRAAASKSKNPRGHGNDEPLKLLRLQAVLDRTGLSRSALYRLIAAGDFPSGISVAGTSAKAWSSAIVTAWIARQLEEAA